MFGCSKRSRVEGSADEVRVHNRRLAEALQAALAVVEEQNARIEVLEGAIEETHDELEQMTNRMPEMEADFQRLRNAVTASEAARQNAERLNGVYVDTIRRLAHNLGLEAERTRNLEFISHQFAQARAFIFANHYTESAILMLAHLVRDRR